MLARTGMQWIAICAVLTVAACGNRDKTPELMNLRSATQGPDEFAILPTKPLQLPEDVASLPEPTPGGGNITDPTPDADIAVALGGKADAVTRRGSVPAVDGGLLNAAGRFGITQDIRTALADEDLEYRRKNDGRLLERVFNVNVYFKAYRRMALDKYAELERWRAAGVKTVGAPPELAN